MALPDGVEKLGEFKGEKGDKGDTGTFAAASATTLAAGSQATVEITGPESAKIVAFGIPRGDKGEKGDPSTVPGPPGGSDAATAEFVSASGSQTNAAVSTLIDAARPAPSSTTVRGIVELATSTEVQQGTDTVRAVTPRALSDWESSIRPPRNRAVIIGSSNALGGAGDWPAVLCAARGWTMHNHAISGTGYCTPSQPFMTQAQAAVAALSVAQRAEVGHIFVADSSNDARSNRTYAEVFAAAKALYAYVRANFPNARIVVLPQVWPADTEKYAPTQFAYDPRWSMSAIVGATAQQDALSEHPRSVVADQSWTWLHGRDDLMTAAGNVHPNAAGHSVIANILDRVLDGETVVTRSGWTTVTPAASTALGGRGRELSVMREGWEVTLSGSALRSIEYTGVVQDYGTIPYGFRPTYQVEGSAVRWDASGYQGEESLLELWPSGAIRLGGTAAGTRRGIMTNTRYRIG